MRSTETQMSDRRHQSYLCSYALKVSLYKGSHRGLGVGGCSRTARKVHGSLWSIVQGAWYSHSDSFHLKPICSTAAASNNAVICFALSGKWATRPTSDSIFMLRRSISAKRNFNIIYQANWWQTNCRYALCIPQRYTTEALARGEMRIRQGGGNAWVPGLCGNWKLLRHFKMKSGYYIDLSLVVLYRCNTFFFFNDDFKRMF